MVNDSREPAPSLTLPLGEEEDKRLQGKTIQAKVRKGACLKTVILRRQPKNLVANKPALTENNETPRYTRGDRWGRTWSPDKIGATGHHYHF